MVCKKNIIIFVLSCFIFITVLYFSNCSLSRNVAIDDFTSYCSHCHGKQLEGINNIKSYCGNCHDIKSNLSPLDIKDENMREAVLSEPHIHNIRNVFTGTPSCFFCHRSEDF